MVIVPAVRLQSALENLRILNKGVEHATYAITGERIVSALPNQGGASKRGSASGVTQARHVTAHALLTMPCIWAYSFLLPTAFPSARLDI